MTDKAAYSLTIGLAIVFMTLRIIISIKTTQLSQQFQAAAITTITKD
jgi:hypothetical protein